jgi:hypothetical protein
VKQIDSSRLSGTGCINDALKGHGFSFAALTLAFINSCKTKVLIRSSSVLAWEQGTTFNRAEKGQ